MNNFKKLFKRDIFSIASHVLKLKCHTMAKITSTMFMDLKKKFIFLTIQVVAVVVAVVHHVVVAMFNRFFYFYLRFSDWSFILVK